MKKFKLFLENFLVYGLGGVISKAIPLIMVPLITWLIPEIAFFGISDMSSAVVSLGTSLAIMGMYDAMYRLFFEKEDDEFKRDICSTAFVFTLFTSFVVFVVMLLAKDFIAQLFFEDKKYAYVVYLAATATLVGATNGIISAPTRMQNKRKIFLITNTLAPILSYAVSIPMLLKGYYVIALPLANLVSNLIIEIIFLALNHRWFSLRRFSFRYLKPLLAIAIPLLPNFIIYWIFNSSDRVMITNLIGISAAGMYAVGAKLGNVSHLIYTAFAGGWQYFAFSTMKEDKQVENNSKIFEYLGIISFACSMFIFALCKPFFELLFTGDYVRGYIVSPYLFLAPLLQMLFQVACNQFVVIKKTWPNLMILSAGAILNIIINLTLIPVMGIEGAALATLLGYAVSDVICVIALCRMKLMVISGRFLLSAAVMIGYILTWRVWFRESPVISTLLAVVCCIVFLLLYKDDISALIRGIKSGNSQQEG